MAKKRHHARKAVRRHAKPSLFSGGKNNRLSILLIILAMLVFALAGLSMSGRWF